MKVLLEAAHTTFTGKGRFACRLQKALQKRDIEVTIFPKAFEVYDIVVGFGKFLDHHLTKKKILRLGDCHKGKKDYKALNKRKIKALKKADGVIYQSRYSQKLCQAFLGVAKCPTTVIFNGADPEEFHVKPMESVYKYNFLASARKWDNNKRLSTIKRAFWKAEIKDSCLWICGDAGQKNGAELDRTLKREMKFLGLVDEHTLASLHKLCNALIDITWLSACPNSVVEALVAGCKVICTDQGGTHEIVQKISEYAIMSEDVEYDFKPTGKFVPKLSTEMVAEHLKHYSNFPESLPWANNCSYIHIDTITKEYLNFFERILNES